MARRVDLEVQFDSFMMRGDVYGLHDNGELVAIIESRVNTSLPLMLDAYVKQLYPCMSVEEARGMPVSVTGFADYLKYQGCALDFRYNSPVAADDQTNVTEMAHYRPIKVSGNCVSINPDYINYCSHQAT